MLKSIDVFSHPDQSQAEHQSAAHNLSDALAESRVEFHHEEDDAIVAHGGRA